MESEVLRNRNLRIIKSKYQSLERMGKQYGHFIIDPITNEKSLKYIKQQILILLDEIEELKKGVKNG